MKNKGEHARMKGEGWLVAAALGAALLFALFVCISRIPSKEMAMPVHMLSYEELRRAEMVNINTAPAEKLARLPGIGEALAERIVAYREANGPFSSPEALMQVDGIGEGKLEGIRSEIYLD